MAMEIPQNLVALQVLMVLGHLEAHEILDTVKSLI